MEDKELFEQLKVGDELHVSIKNGTGVTRYSGKLKKSWTDPHGNGWVRISHGFNRGGQELVNTFPFNMTDEYQEYEENKTLDALIMLTDLFPQDYRLKVLDDLAREAA